MHAQESGVTRFPEAGDVGPICPHGRATLTDHFDSSHANHAIHFTFSAPVFHDFKVPECHCMSDDDKGAGPPYGQQRLTDAQGILPLIGKTQTTGLGESE